MFQRYVVTALDECCKNRSGCCICCNGCTCMLQASVINVSSFFSDVCCKCVYLNVAYASHICCKYFIWMLRMFCNGFQVFLQVFHTHVPNVSSIFRRILQVLHLDISKLDRVLHMGCVWKAGGAMSGPRVQPGGPGPAWAHKMQTRRAWSAGASTGVECMCARGK